MLPQRKGGHPISVFAISDTHLSLGTDKPMDKFGSRWKNYVEKLTSGWDELVAPSDTVVIPGDISWGMTMEESLPDFLYLQKRPGHKIIGKGNHDYWWSTVSKMSSFLSENGVDSVSFLNNNAFLAEDKIICGSRGWYSEDGAPATLSTADGKVLLRECQRLRTSIKEGKALRDKNPGASLHVFLHYPPVYGDYTCPEIMEVLSGEGIENCYYGHIHTAQNSKIVRQSGGVTFTCIAADYLYFEPMPIIS
ncbi:MAG: metallophosphoesterase [Eubacteriales bacterium]